MQCILCILQVESMTYSSEGHLGCHVVQEPQEVDIDLGGIPWRLRDLPGQAGELLLSDHMHNQC